MREHQPDDMFGSPLQQLVHWLGSELGPFSSLQPHAPESYRAVDRRECQRFGFSLFTLVFCLLPMTLLTSSLPARPSRPDIVVVGGVNTDYVMKMHDLPLADQATVAQEFHHLPGGKGLNQAVAAARLGAKVALVAMLGKDQRADEIRERLDAEGIDTRYVFHTDNAYTGATLILVDDHGATLRSAFPGANRVLLHQDISIAAPLLAQAGLVLAQLEVPVPSVRHAFELARQAKVRTMLDAGPPTAIDEDLLRVCSILRANAEEAQALSGCEVRDRDGALKAARSLLPYGIEVLAVGTGAGGNAVLTSDAMFTYAPDKASPVDKAGAGDAFSAAFAVALLEGRNYQEAGAYAHAASAYSVTRVGALASLPSRRELEALLTHIPY